MLGAVPHISLLRKYQTIVAMLCIADFSLLFLSDDVVLGEIAHLHELVYGLAL